MSFGNSERYDAYREEGILNSDPVHLIVLLYEGAIQAVEDATTCLKTGDIAGRAKHVTKAVKIINELLFSLRDGEATAVSQNLRRLYVYMQSKLLHAHTQKDSAALAEVRALLSTLLEGWRTISKSQPEMSAPVNSRSEDYRSSDTGSPEDANSPGYAPYEGEDEGCRLVACF